MAFIPRPIRFWGPLSAFGLSLGALTAIADQASKWWMLKIFDIEARGQVAVTPFLDLVMVWNRGISYGLFQQGGTLGQILLAALAVAAVFGLTLWLARMSSVIGAAGAGLVMGGAVGNAIDRVVHGAVADFFSFHAGDFYWYVFNVADAAIVAGVAGLMYDSIFNSHKKVSKTS
jgi:signal peptidase II